MDLFEEEPEEPKINEEEHEIDLDRIIEPLPKTEEEQMAIQLAKGLETAMKTMEASPSFQKLLETQKEQKEDQNRKEMRVHLTKEQYVTLGKPTLNDRVDIQLRKRRG